RGKRRLATPVLERPAKRGALVPLFRARGFSIGRLRVCSVVSRERGGSGHLRGAVCAKLRRVPVSLLDGEHDLASHLRQPTPDEGTANLHRGHAKGARVRARSVSGARGRTGSAARGIWWAGARSVGELRPRFGES